MCGIAGALNFFENNITVDNLIRNLNKNMSHRGPDKFDFFYKKEEGIFLFHSRLSIIDLSINATQPFTSFSSRYIITFNGEIYNFLKLKKQLSEIKNINWKSSSDTEVLVNAIDIWGIDNALDKIEGMFAFAIFDKKEKNLYLARDRSGEKPIYYYFDNKKFFFASEQKALNCFVNINKNINFHSIEYFLKYGYVPNDINTYHNTYKLKPGTYLKLSFNMTIKTKSYWSLKSIEKNKNLKNFYVTNQPIDEIYNLLEESIRKTMISDVPIGIFLSGGIDSSIIAAMSQKNSKKKIKTFSYSFDQESYNESFYSKIVSESINSDHIPIKIQDKEICDLIPNLHQIFDEPFSDPSQIPLYFLSKAASKEVKVVLTGDGADEIFGGYKRHEIIPKMWLLINFLPMKSRGYIKEKLSNFFPRKILEKFILGHGTDRFDKFINCIDAKTKIELLDKSISNSNYQDLLNRNLLNDDNFGKFDDDLFLSHNYYDFILNSDFSNYLPNNILLKLDRVSMANSIEARAPFLDRSIIEFSQKLNRKYKTKKFILKQMINQKKIFNLDSNFFNRNKQGFDFPIKYFLDGPLKSWKNYILDKIIFSHDSFFDKKKTQFLFENYQNNFLNQQLVWRVLLVKSWLLKNEI